jgi:hypothetical protein
MGTEQETKEVIHFWEQKLVENGTLINLTAIVMIENTIRKLKRLEEVDCGKEGNHKK